MLRYPLVGRVTAWWGAYGLRLVNAVIHDVRQHYAGSLFDSLWAFLYPMALLAFYATIYVAIFKVRAPGLAPESYTILVMAGLVPLLMFNEALAMGTNAIIGQRNLLLNTVFPAELLPLRAVLASQVPSLAALAMTVFATTLNGQLSPWALIIVPVLWVLLISFVMGLVWILSLVALIARDVQHFISLIGMAMVVLSPMAYTPEMVPNSIKFILWFNPLSYFVLSFQNVLALAKPPELGIVAIAVALGLSSAILGYRLFRKTKFVFIDHA